MKRCKQCENIKPLEDFSKNSSMKNSVINSCKKCIQKYQQQYYQRYKKVYKKRSITYRKRNKDKYGLGAGTISIYGFRLALAVYEKGNRKCEQCENENDLTIHHKDRNGRNRINLGLKPNNDIDNLILLCRSCHGSIHGKEGKGISHKNKKNK